MYPYIAKQYDTRYWYRIWQKKGHVRKPLVSSFPKFNVHEFIKTHKALLPSTFAISNTKGVAVKLEVSIDNLKIYSEGYKAYSLAIEVVPCGFGGERYFVRCRCGRRYKILYFALQCILCRRCFGLKYFSQRLAPNDRYLEMKDKIEEKFKKRKGGWDGYKRPYYMHKKTYSRLSSKAIDYESKAIDYMDKIFHPYIKKMYGM
jgi:hypothetical protein